MKTVFVFLLSVCLYGTTLAQINFNIEVVPADEVPEAVLSAHNGYFPNISVLSWEKQTASGRNESLSRFVASFKEADKTLTRARYLQNGEGITATTYHPGPKLPSVIKDAAAEHYADYTLMSGEKLLLLPTGKNIFRIRLRKGVSKKLVVYLNNDGEEISRKDIPKEVVEEENIENS